MTTWISTAPPRERHRRPAPEQAVALAAFVVATVSAAGIGSLATSATTDSTWFRSLDTPWFYPPSSAFGIVWTVLYVMIAAAGFLGWRRGAGTPALVAWAVQIALNLGWTLVFFGLRRPGWSLVEIVVLLAAIVVTIRLFGRVSRSAALLLVPYLAWVGFATALTASICWLNR